MIARQRGAQSLILAQAPAMRRAKPERAAKLNPLGHVRCGGVRPPVDPWSVVYAASVRAVVSGI